MVDTSSSLHIYWPQEMIPRTREFQERALAHSSTDQHRDRDYPSDEPQRGEDVTGKSNQQRYLRYLRKATNNLQLPMSNVRIFHEQSL